MSADSQTLALLLTQITMGLLFYITTRKKGLKTYLRIKPLQPIMYLWAFVIGLSLVNLSGLLILIMGAIIPEQLEAYIEAIEASIGGANAILAFFVVVIGASLVEEVMLRGLFFRKFENLVNGTVLVILSGFFFGVFHLNIIQGVFTTVIGIFFALGFYWTKSLWIPIFMHAGNNFFAWAAGNIIPEAWLETIPFAVVSYSLLIFIAPYGFYQLYLYYKNQDSLNSLSEDSILG
jgi:membrane protease YdiL (CAAX protease family)